MASYAKYRYCQRWVAGGYYHVYNHAVHANNCFITVKDCKAFLEMIEHRWTFFAHIFAYCLIPNHFHVAILIKSEEEIAEALWHTPLELRGAYTRKYLAGKLTFDAMIGQLVGDAMSGYAQKFNSDHKRKGPLMHRPIRRVETHHGEFSRKLIAYIQLNYAKHGLGKHTDPFRWSSLSTTPTFVNRELLYDEFGGEADYVRFHKTYMQRWGAQFHDFDEEKFFGIVKG